MSKICISWENLNSSEREIGGRLYNVFQALDIDALCDRVSFERESGNLLSWRLCTYLSYRIYCEVHASQLGYNNGMWRQIRQDACNLFSLSNGS
jgi:hypothetical protein